MARYILRRLAVTGAVLLACSVLVFALLLAVRGPHPVKQSRRAAAGRSRRAR